MTDSIDLQFSDAEGLALQLAAADPIELEFAPANEPVALEFAPELLDPIDLKFSQQVTQTAEMLAVLLGNTSGVDPSGAFLVVRRLGEIASDPVAQQQAQTNLGLGVSDPVAYYILAKS